jgi:hypothetical protein
MTLVDILTFLLGLAVGTAGFSTFAVLWKLR